MRIYTRTGDKGETSLVSGERVPKNHLRVEAYGTCDEANAVIGVATSTIDQGITWSIQERKKFVESIRKVQTLLFHAGAELSTPTDQEVAWPIKQEHIDFLEETIDVWEEQVPSLTQFILPNGHPTGATLHQARTIVRRTERLAVGLKDEVNPLALKFINRLSDFLFVAARYVNTFSAFEEEGFEKLD